MSETIQEQIEVMQHFANGGEVEHLLNDGTWRIITAPTWDWWKCTYRIKEQKKTFTIEKWLVTTDFSYNFTVETDDIERLCTREELIKIKLLDSYEVQI